MARPMKTGLDFLALDCKMSDEVHLIIADFGMEGYGVLVSMFQSIYGEKGYYADWTTREKKLFSRKVGTSQDVLVSIIDECVEWGIFDKGMYDKFKILTSVRVQKHYATATYKRTGTTMNTEYLLIDITDKQHINVQGKPTNNIVTDDGNSSTTAVTDVQSTQSKVEYSRVEKKRNKKNKPIVKQFADDSFEIKMCKALILRIRELNPEFKEPNIGKWALEFDRMKRLDNRQEEEMVSLLDWATKDGFWRTNILSPSKFRKQYDQLKMKSNTSGQSKGVAEEWEIS